MTTKSDKCRAVLTLILPAGFLTALVILFGEVATHDAASGLWVWNLDRVSQAEEPLFPDECFSADDLFDALCLLRDRLESSGTFLLCNGACLNVFPSGMAREMSHGRKAYILNLGVQPAREDLIGIFEPAASSQVVSVAAQQAYFDKWTASI